MLFNVPNEWYCTVFLLSFANDWVTVMTLFGTTLSINERVMWLLLLMTLEGLNQANGTCFSLFLKTFHLPSRSLCQSIPSGEGEAVKAHDLSPVDHVPGLSHMNQGASGPETTWVGESRCRCLTGEIWVSLNVCALLPALDNVYNITQFLFGCLVWRVNRFLSEGGVRGSTAACCSRRLL